MRNVVDSIIQKSTSEHMPNPKCQAEVKLKQNWIPGRELQAIDRLWSQLDLESDAPNANEIERNRRQALQAYVGAAIKTHAHTEGTRRGVEYFIRYPRDRSAYSHDPIEWYAYRPVVEYVGSELIENGYLELDGTYKPPAEGENGVCGRLYLREPMRDVVRQCVWGLYYEPSPERRVQCRHVDNGRWVSTPGASQRVTASRELCQEWDKVLQNNEITIRRDTVDRYLGQATASHLVQTNRGKQEREVQSRIHSLIPLLCQSGEVIDFPVGTHTRKFQGTPDKPLEYEGRFHAHYMNMPTRLRDNIRMNGEPICEIDYSSMQPRILLNLDGKSDLPRDIYQAERLDHLSREAVKTTYQLAINSSDLQKAVRENIPESVLGTLSPKGWLNMLKSHSNLFQKALNASETWGGGKLRQYESEIAAGVVSEFVSDGIPILAVHDSFIVPAKQFSRLGESMKSAYNDVIGSDDPPLHVEVEPPESEI